MAIKFTCPHCQASMAVPDELAGKRGKCRKCQGGITVPGGGPAVSPKAAPAKAATSPAPAPAARAPKNGTVSAPAAPPAAPSAKPKDVPAPAPAPDPGDVEAEAAALFSDEPKVEQEVEVKTIDFLCDYCGETSQLDVSLAGKKHPCPLCRRISKVPELKKQEKKDWRSENTNLPLGAKRPDQPAPEGAWGAGTASRVSVDSLEEAGALPVAPRTWREKARPFVYLSAALGVVLGGVLIVMNWRHNTREQRAIKRAIDYAGSDKAREEVGQGQAALHAGAGTYYVRSKRSNCADPARKHYAQAISILAGARGGERDALLGEIAAAQVELGSSASADLDDGRALRWPLAQKAVLAAITPIRFEQAKLDALRTVARRLIARGEVGLVLPLAGQAYSAPAQRAEALAACGLDLLATGHRKEAEKAADDALKSHRETGSTPLSASLVALAVALERRPPPPRKGDAGDEGNERIGKAEGWAHRDDWEKARSIAKNIADAEERFRAYVALAGAALDAKTGDKSDAEAALKIAADRPGIGKPRHMSWALLRLARLSLQAGLGEDQAAVAVDAISNPGAKAWGRLIVLRGRLAAAKQTVGADVLDQVPADTLAQLVAREELARHNVRQESSWERTAQSWEGGGGFFGSLGVALALQGGK